MKSEKNGENNNPVIGRLEPVVDEFLSKDGKSCLYFAYYDEQGVLHRLVDLDRDASPLEISETLNDMSDVLLEYPPRGVTLDAILDKAEELRDLAKSVPGLEIKNKK